MRRTMIALAAAALVVAAQAPAQTPEQVVERALRAAPVWDGHNDLPDQLRERRRNVIAGVDLHDTSDIPSTQPMQVPIQTDLARLRKGRVGAQFWSVYVAPTLNEQQAVQATLEQIDLVYRLAARYPRELQIATTADEVERAMKQGRIASLIGIEGGHSIGSSLGVLRQMYALGARYMTLAHYRTIGWADSATDKPQSDGLNDFGRDVVREMQRIGMVVDLSHVSDATMNDALDVAKAPVIFSHSGARGVAGHSRNVPDDVLDRLKANGGIVMVIPMPSYVSEEMRLWSVKRAAEQARLEGVHKDRAAVGPAMAQWIAANPMPKATIGQLADHVDYIAKRIGVDHVGIGGDFDGMPVTIPGMEDVSGYPALFLELARRGYSQADLEKISSRNMMRVLRAAEAYAAKHRMDPPIESPTTF